MLSDSNLLVAENIAGDNIGAGGKAAFVSGSQSGGWRISACVSNVYCFISDG